MSRETTVPCTRIFSGIQPTGALHLGNYVGAVQNWVRMQETYDCIICIVDLHALTIEFDPHTYQERIVNMAIDLLACGIDPCAVTPRARARSQSAPL